MRAIVSKRGLAAVLVLTAVLASLRGRSGLVFSQETSGANAAPIACIAETGRMIEVIILKVTDSSGASDSNAVGRFAVRPFCRHISFISNVLIVRYKNRQTFYMSAEPHDSRGKSKNTFRFRGLGGIILVLCRWKYFGEAKCRLFQLNKSRQEASK